MKVSVLFVGALLLLSETLALEHRSRDLMADHEEGYGELACNADASPKINTDDCLVGAAALSTILGDSTTVSSQVIIPCGTCYIVDYTDGETITLEAGLNVLGRLHFPSTTNMVLNTTSVVVQGMWSMTTPDIENRVKINLYGKEDVYVYPQDQCCYSDNTCDSECMHKVNMESKPFAVVGGQLDIRAIDTDCPSWTTLKNSDQASNTFTIDSAFTSCLAEGDELVVAGDEIGNHGHKRYTVASVSGEDVLVEEDILREYATEAGPGESMFATEVAKLTRRVLFEGSEDVDNIGAHSIIFHTPDVVQTIQGVSFKGFGQGGKLGRYPIHFHKSDDTNSLVSKNIIRDSLQRCIFIHNTNYVTIEDNVAYNTRGHCYATETGIEHDNIFVKNLAVASHKLHIPGNGQSDDPTKAGTGAAAGNAAFWIRNMMNTFVGNRVAGCGDSGFWLEMKDKKGNQLNDNSFDKNVAHGCGFGLLTYKHGWTPTEPAHFKNMMVYKNRDGFKMHFTGNLKFTNFVAADDSIYRYGFGNVGVDFENSLFIGLSDDARLRFNRNCAYTNSGIYASFNTQPDKHKQINFKDVEFRNFNCNSRAITWYMDDRFSNKNMGDPVKFTNISFSGSTLGSNRPALSCGALYSQNWFMEDADGLLGPNGKGPGFIIKDNAQMQAFLNDCEPLTYSGCSAMCEGACLRLVHIEPVGAGPFHSLTLTDQATETSFEYTLDTFGYTAGKAVLVVPKATYLGSFKDLNGNIITPSLVNIETFRASEVCESYVESTDFLFETSECGGWYPEGGEKVVFSTGFESSSGGTWGDMSTSPYSPGASGEKASAMTYLSEPTGSTLPALRLDIKSQEANACIRGGTKLAVYFKAKLLSMTDDESPVDCTPGVNCPSGRFRARQDVPGSDAVYCNGWFNLPRSIVSWNKDNFNEVSSLFTVPSSCAGTEWTWFFLDITMGKGYPVNTVKMIVDDVKIVVDEGQYTFPPTYAPIPSPTSGPTAPILTQAPTTKCDTYYSDGEEKILLNEGFESSSKGTWGGGASTKQISPGASGDGYASALTYTEDPGNMLPAIRLDVSRKNECVRGGMELNVTFKAKMLDMTNNNSPVDCTPGSNCPTARFRARQDNPEGGVYCNGWYHIPKPTTEWNASEWNIISTVSTVPTSCKGTKWRWLLFDITQGSKYPANTVQLLVDDVIISIKED